MSVRWARALAMAASRSIAIGVSDGGVGRLDACRPEVGLRRVEDQIAQPILDRLDPRFRVDDRFLVARDLGFRLDDVDRRQRPDLHLGPVALERLLRELERLDRDLVPFERANQIEVGVAHRLRRHRDLLAQPDVGDDLVVLRGRDLLAEAVDLEVAEQRLHDARREIARQLGVVAAVGRAGRDLAAAEREAVVAAAPRDVLRQPAILGEALGRQQRAGAGDEGARRLGAAPVEEVREQHRRVRGPRARDRQGVDLRRQALGLDPEVVFERHPHRVVGTETRHRPGLGGGRADGGTAGVVDCWGAGVCPEANTSRPEPNKISASTADGKQAERAQNIDFKGIARISNGRCGSKPVQG